MKTTTENFLGEFNTYQEGEIAAKQLFKDCELTGYVYIRPLKNIYECYIDSGSVDYCQFSLKKN